jgi:hypothetical protein
MVLRLQESKHHGLKIPHLLLQNPGNSEIAEDLPGTGNNATLLHGKVRSVIPLKFVKLYLFNSCCY